MQNKLWSVFIEKVRYDIELISDLLVTTAAGVAYGYIEAFWVPTSIWVPAALPIFGWFSYYHVGFFSLMLALTTGLVVTHYQWFDPKDRKEHIIYAIATFLAILPLAFMVEDMSWFALQLRPITPKDWTMIIPGFGPRGVKIEGLKLGWMSVGVTWIPDWYIGVILSTCVFLTIALTYATKSYDSYQTHQELVGQLISWLQTEGYDIRCGNYSNLTQCEEIHGYIPDVKGKSNGLDAYGEAKTADDIDNDHTKEQFQVFGRVMTKTQKHCPCFIAIPKGSENALRRVLRELGLDKSSHVRWRAF